MDHHNATIIQRRWNYAQSVHDLLLKCDKKGSMLNILNNDNDGIITKSDFLHRVRLEFNSNAAELSKFFDSFQQVAKPSTSGYDLLVPLHHRRSLAVKASHIQHTYLAVTYFRTVMDCPLKVVLKLCDACTHPDYPNDICTSDLRDIINLGSIENNEDLEDLLHMWIQRYSSRSVPKTNTLINMKSVKEILDIVPGFVLRFRDNICDRLTDDNRLALITEKENSSSSRSEAIVERVLIKRANRLWKSLLYKCFIAWHQTTQRSMRMNLQKYQLRYWKAKRSICLWHTKMISTISYHEVKVIASKTYIKRTKRRHFLRWKKVASIQRRFRFETKTRKNIALGVSIVRLAINRLKVRTLIRIWHQEATVQLRMDYARQWRSKYTLHASFRYWLQFLSDVRIEVAENDHRRFVSEKMMLLTSNVARSINKNDGISAFSDTKDISNVRSEARDRRIHYEASVDVALIEVQKRQKRARFKEQKEKLKSLWASRWAIEEDQRIRRARKKVLRWMRSREGKNKIAKYVKRLERELNYPTTTISTSCAVIALSVLDSRVGHGGYSVDYFFEMLGKVATHGMLNRSRFEKCLEEMNLTLSSHESRDIFEGVAPDDSDQIVDVAALRKALTDTYDITGAESCQWKRYIDPIHNISVLHNTVEGKKVMDYRLDKKTMQDIAHDYFASQNTVKERKKIHAEKVLDLQRTTQIWAASMIQTSWKMKKRLEKTHRRIRLATKATSVS